MTRCTPWRISGRLLITVTLLLLSSCTHLPLNIEPSQASPFTRTISRTDSAGAYAAPAGNMPALADSGLVLIDQDSGKRLFLADVAPAAIAWSPAGEHLAAAFTDGSGATLKLFDSNGTLRSTSRIDGNINGLFFTAEQELIAIAITTKPRRFGTSCTQLLYRWKIGSTPVATALHDTTIMPLSLQKYGLTRLSQQLKPVISPWNDELLYAKLANPPVATPYYKLFVRNLINNAEYEIATVGIDTTAMAFSSDGEQALWTSPDRMVWQRRLWEDGQAVLLPGSNDSIPVTHAVAPVLTILQRSKLINVRAWRAAGLISAKEYADSKKRILNQ